MKIRLNNIIQLFFISVLCASSVYATHNVSRYFPFLERPEEYTIKKRSHITPSFIYLNASTAYRRGGGTCGIPELWGRYDLKDVISSLREVQPTADPIFRVTGSHDLDDKSMVFNVKGKNRGQGIQLNYEQELGWHGFQCGVSIPLMALQTTSYFEFNPSNSDDYFQVPMTEQDAFQQSLLVDKIRRTTHKMIGFQGNELNQGGFGDLDLHVRWNRIFDHVLLMRSIDINFQLGGIVPTGFTSNPDIPPSLSIGSDGHWGLYGDFVTALELRQDWTLGFMLGCAGLFSHTRDVRIPSMAGEPAIYSAIRGDVRCDPGVTFKFSTYFILANLTDGLDFHVRYTYLHHQIDHWKDMRSAEAQQSTPTYLAVSDLVGRKESLSKWTNQYVTMQVSYDAEAAMKKYFMRPVVFVGYDIPVGGNGVSKTHQITVGVELHF
jgi:hypothetical protein